MAGKVTEFVDSMNGIGIQVNGKTVGFVDEMFPGDWAAWEGGDHEGQPYRGAGIDIGTARTKRVAIKKLLDRQFSRRRRRKN